MATATLTPSATPPVAAGPTPAQIAEVENLLNLELQIRTHIDAKTRAGADEETKLLSQLATGAAAADAATVLNRFKAFETFKAQNETDRNSLDRFAELVRKQKERLKKDHTEIVKSVLEKRLAESKAARLREKADVAKIDAEIKALQKELESIGGSSGSRR